MTTLINEDFDSHLYDLILDKYNEVGMEGMAQDEIEYLKSGGESEIPASMRQPEPKKVNIDKLISGGDDDYGDTMESDGDVHEILRNLSELYDSQNGTLYKTSEIDNFFLIRFVYSEELFREIINIMHGQERYKDNFGNYIKVGVDTGKTRIGIGIPLMYFNDFFQ